MYIIDTGSIYADFTSCCAEVTRFGIAYTSFQIICRINSFFIVIFKCKQIVFFLDFDVYVWILTVLVSYASHHVIILSKSHDSVFVQK